jgi:septal ring-binding cell division protein DamX
VSSAEVVLLLLFHSHEPLRYVRSHVAIVASPPSPIPCRAVCSLASLLVEPDPAEPAQHLLASHCLTAFLPASSQPLEPLSEASLLCCRAVPSAASRRRRPLPLRPTTNPVVPRRSLYPTVRTLTDDHARNPCPRARSSTSDRPGVREARPRSTPATVLTSFAVIRSSQGS